MYRGKALIYETIKSHFRRSGGVDFKKRSDPIVLWYDIFHYRGVI